MVVRQGLVLALMGTEGGRAVSALIPGILYGARPLDPMQTLREQ